MIDWQCCWPFVCKVGWVALWHSGELEICFAVPSCADSVFPAALLLVFGCSFVDSQNSRLSWQFSFLLLLANKLRTQGRRGDRETRKNPTKAIAVQLCVSATEVENSRCGM